MPSTVELEWSPTKQAILGPDPEMVLYGEVSVWFHKVSLFRRGENERMYLREPNGDDLQIHKALLLRLISDGRHLAEIVSQCGGLVQNPAGIQTRDLEATVDSLRSTLRGWHEPMPKEKREQILHEVFGDVAQPAH